MNNNEYQFNFEELDPFYSNALEKRRKKSINSFAKSLLAFVLVITLSGGISLGSIYVYDKYFLPENQNVDVTKTNSNTQSSVTYLPTSTADALTIPQIYQKNIDSVVAITTSVLQNGYQSSIGTGTGIIMNDEGYILTNAHVIDGGNKITVKLSDNLEYDAEIIGADSKVDIAVLKIQAENLVPGNFGDANQLTFGEPAVVIGNPLGTFAGTVTDGIISATSREVQIDNYIMKLLQTNAAVNPGNSGGPLINCRGEIVGVVSSKISADDVEGIGFAIPIDTALSVADDFINYGYVKNRPMLGVTIEVVSQYYAQVYGTQPGLRVASVLDGSASDLAGILPGDRIIRFNDVSVSTSVELDYEKDKFNVGDTVTITVLRNGEELTLNLTLMENTGN